jgi:hypothetical protein
MSKFSAETKKAVPSPMRFVKFLLLFLSLLAYQPACVREFDPNNRPQYPVEPGTEPIREVI